MSNVTRILERAEHGDPTAADELLPLVYSELRRLAAHKMAGEAPEPGSKIPLRPTPSFNFRRSH